MKRFEIKFDVTDINLNKILSTFHLSHLYPQRMITSIYYDTKNMKYFNDSEEGIIPRRKIRMRSYDNKVSLNLEVKETMVDYRKKFVFKNIDNNHINYHLKKNLIYDEKLIPIIKVVYLRKYYQCSFGRVTFDYNLRYYDLNFGNFSPIVSNKKILELKNESVNLKNKFIQKCFLKNIRFSKYCDGVNLFLDR